MKIYEFRLNCHYFFPEGPSNNVPDNGSAPIRRQAIIWTNNAEITDAYNASLGLNELSYTISIWLTAHQQISTSINLVSAN